MINNYVKTICGMLGLPMPQVFYNDRALRQEEHARLTPDGRQLYLRKLKTASLDLLVAAAAELSGINRTSLYKIMDGTVQPQRNTLLRLALTLEMDFEQCQQLLKAGSAAQLTSSRLRDRIIMVGLLNREPLDEISRTLDEQGFINLYAKG